MTVLQDQASHGRDDDFKTLLALHAIAMSGMEHGLCVFDKDLRIVLFNRRCLDILQLPPEAMKLGTSLRAMLDLVGDDGAVIVGDVRNERRPPRPGEVTHSVTVRVDDVSCRGSRP